MFFTILLLVYLMLLGIIDVLLLKDIQVLKRHSHFHFYNDDYRDDFKSSFPDKEGDDVSL